MTSLTARRLRRRVDAGISLQDEGVDGRHRQRAGRDQPRVPQVTPPGDETIVGYAFISPVVLGLLIWTFGPMLASALLTA